MDAMIADLASRLSRGDVVALCVVVATRGSTPQGRGAKMLVTAAGQTVGTLGGGCVEAEVRKRAMEQIQQRASRFMTFRLDQDYGWDDGLICGGAMDVLIDIVHGESRANEFAAVASAMAAQRGTRLSLPYADEHGPHIYFEEIGPPPVLLIVGAGHVGQALAGMMTTLGFAVDVIDDRSDFATRERFASARNLIVGDIETLLPQQTIDDNTYVVIVTRGHRNDGRALEKVVRSNARYLGLIGSKSKIKKIFAELQQQGVSFDELAKVHAPIGLDIGSITVPEIALSIAAELVAVRHGKSGPAKPMQLPADELRKWLEAQK